MKLIDKTVFVIMSKDREYIAGGNVRDRNLIKLSDPEETKQRILTYMTKGKAESAFKTSGFFGWPYGQYQRVDGKSAYMVGKPQTKETRMEMLEAVEVRFTMEVIE